MEDEEGEEVYEALVGIKPLVDDPSLTGITLCIFAVGSSCSPVFDRLYRQNNIFCPIE